MREQGTSTRVYPCVDMLDSLGYPSVNSQQRRIEGPKELQGLAMSLLSSSSVAQPRATAVPFLRATRDIVVCVSVKLSNHQKS